MTLWNFELCIVAHKGGAGGKEGKGGRGHKEAKGKRPGSVVEPEQQPSPLLPPQSKKLELDGVPGVGEEGLMSTILPEEVVVEILTDRLQVLISMDYSDLKNLILINTSSRLCSLVIVNL